MIDYEKLKKSLKHLELQFANYRHSTERPDLSELDKEAIAESHDYNGDKAQIALTLRADFIADAIALYQTLSFGNLGVVSVLDITSEQRSLLLELLLQHLPNVKVWAFGSRVKGVARTTSDLDLAIFSSPEQRSRVFALQEALDESNLPFKVDLLIWDEIPVNFKTNIQQHYIELVGDPLLPPISAPAEKSISNRT